MLERAYKIKLDAYGAKNAELAPTLFNLASAKEDLRKRNEAREYMTRAMETFREFFGEKHANTQRAAQWLKARPAVEAKAKTDRPAPAGGVREALTQAGLKNAFQ